MNFNKKLLDNLTNRQTYQTSYYSSKYYKFNLIKSFNDPSNLIKTHYEKNDSQDIGFSKDDKFFFSVKLEGIKIWDIENNSTYENSFQQINHRFMFCPAIVPCFDNSKLIYQDFWTIIILDLNTFSIKKIHSLPSIQILGNVLMDVKNYNLATFSNYDNLFTLDLREKKSQKIPESDFVQKIFCLDVHPNKDHLILVKTLKHGLFSLDTRNYKPDFFYNSSCFDNKKDWFAKYNKNGSQFLLSLDESNSYLYNLNTFNPIFEFQKSNTISSQYGFNYNCFLGLNDEYFVMKSSDFNFYLWEIPVKKKIENDQSTNKTKTVSTVKRIFKKPKGGSKYWVCYNREYSILVLLNKGIKEFYSLFPFKLKPKVKCKQFKNIQLVKFDQY